MTTGEWVFALSVIAALFVLCAALGTFRFIYQRPRYCRYCGISDRLFGDVNRRKED